MPNGQATKKRSQNESTLTLRRVPDVLDELKDINGAIQQRDRVEVRIALKGIPAQDLSLLLADHELVLRGDARDGEDVKGKWLLVRVDLPPGVSLDSATAAVESGNLLVILRRQEGSAEARR